MVVCENPSRSAVCEILRPARLTPTTIPRSKSLKSPFFPVLMLGLNFSKSSSPHLDPKCIELLPCDWLISNVCYQAIEQEYLIKWPVSVYIWKMCYVYMLNIFIYNVKYKNIIYTCKYFLYVYLYICYIINTQYTCIYYVNNNFYFGCD